MQERFPQEIVEYVIDQIVVVNRDHADDRFERLYAAIREGENTAPLPSRPVPLNWRLSACAMVSRSWVQRSRHHHFTSLNFGLGDQAEMLAAFVNIIRSPLSTVNHHVTKIRLDHVAKLPDVDVMALAMLPNIKSVSLEDTLSRERVCRVPSRPHEDASLTQPPYLSALLEHFTHLKHLKLSYIQLNSFTQLIEIISASDTLETLSIERVILTVEPLTYDGILENLPPPPPALRSFHIAYPGSQMYELLYLWLLESPTPLLIDTLDICDHANHPQNIPSLLKSSGSSLEHLTIRHVRTETDDILPSYNLSHNPRLKSFTLHWDPVGVPADIVVAESVRLCNTIKQISSSVIETITLAISGSRPNIDTVRLMNLAEMDSCLQRPNFTSLRSESVRLDTGYCAENHEYEAAEVILEWLHATFPQSLARGIIHSGFSHDDKYGM